MFSTKLSIVAAAFAAMLVTGGASLAENPPAEVPLDPVLEKLLAEEKAYRKACKIEICSVLASKQAEGADIGCHIVKTWAKQDLTKMIQASRMSWPLGTVHCQADLKLKRADLAMAMSEAKHDVQMDEHAITCDIDREAEGEKYTIKLSIAPKISFENGKAIAAELKWGAVEAPAVVKGVIWPAATLDNSLGVFSGEVVKTVNQFAEKKCLEVKNELKLN